MLQFITLFACFTIATSTKTNTLWKVPKGPKLTRPKWAGDAEYTTTGGNIVSMSATVIPMEGFTRPSTTPKPSNGRDCSGQTNCMLQRGHIIGLELGGPNIKENIVPQLAGWQQSGGWKKMEDTIKEQAKKAYGNAYKIDKTNTIKPLKGPAKLFKMTVTIKYEHKSDPKYPSEFIVVYGIDGAQKTATLKQPLPPTTSTFKEEAVTASTKTKKAPRKPVKQGIDLDKAKQKRIDAAAASRKATKEAKLAKKRGIGHKKSAFDEYMNYYDYYDDVQDEKDVTYSINNYPFSMFGNIGLLVVMWVVILMTCYVICCGIGCFFGYSAGKLLSKRKQTTDSHQCGQVV